MRQLKYTAITTNDQEMVNFYIKEGWQIHTITITGHMFTYHFIWTAES